MALKLNIGAGPNVFPFPGWVNYDHANFKEYFDYITKADLCGPEYTQLLQRYLKGGGLLDCREHDIRIGFAHHVTSSVDVIYLGQVIEHLNPVYEVPKLLQECYRMLRPGGVLRITTPDLDLLIKAYLAGDMQKFSYDQPAFYTNAHPSAQLAFLMYGACGPKCTWTNYEGHMFLFTEASMQAMLKEAGFMSPIFYREGGKSVNTEVAIEVFDAGMSHSFITEVVK